MRFNFMVVAAIGFGLFGMVQVVTAGPSTNPCDLPKTYKVWSKANIPGVFL